jgi:hypothetical protein
MAMLCCLFSWKEAYPYARTSGSLELNYQELQAQTFRTHSSGQRLLLNFADQLWVKNRLLLSVDLVRNQYSLRDRVDFRPRLSMDLSGYKYHAYYSISPYQTFGSLGSAINHRVVQANLSVQPAKWPNLAFSYRQIHTFDEGETKTLDNLSRNLTLSSRWQYKSFNLRGTFLRQEGVNKLTSTRNYLLSAVTGESRFSFRLPFGTSTAWDYTFSFTQRRIADIETLRTPSHSFSTLWGGRPWSFLRWSVNYQGRLVETKRDRSVSRSQAHSFYGGVGLSLTRKWEISVNRASTVSRMGSATSQTDYVSLLSTLGSSQVIDNLHATASFRRTYYIRTQAGRYALNLLYLSSRAAVYRDFEARLDLTIKYNDNPLVARSRYEVEKNLTVATRPRANLKIDFNYQATANASKMVFLVADLESYRLDFTYLGKGNVSLRTAYQANLYQGRGIPDSYSLSGELSFPYGNVLSSSTVYVRRWTRDPKTGEGFASDNLSVQFNFSLARRTKLGLTYYVTDLTQPTSTSSLGLTMNQQF